MTSRTFGLGMAAVALLVGRAIHLNDGYYTTSGLVLITAAIVVCGAVTLLPRTGAGPLFRGSLFRAAAEADCGPFFLLACAVAAETVMLVRSTPIARTGLMAIGVLGLLQVFRLGRLRVPVIAATLALFCIVASIVFWRVKLPPIDVLVFQQIASARLLHGQSPYSPVYPNLYGPDTPFYGPGVVDSAGQLTIGLPYPPLTLLLTLPAYIFGGDVRYADVFAIAAAALLMVLFRPGRWTALVAMVFLLTPRVLFVIEQSWTEALFVAAFALVMYCAVRWRAALPYALGVFFATKQYAVITVPFVSFLAAGEDKAAVGRLIAKAALIAAAITLPFVLWDPSGFWRSVVQFQFMQPMRMDALTYLVWMNARVTQPPLVLWTPVIALTVAIALLLWRCPRSPAHFAAATTLSSMVFFAFNKQAFCNYYYYVIATACCAAAASGIPAERSTRIRLE